jgi:two-component system LytT family response regulator
MNSEKIKIIVVDDQENSIKLFSKIISEVFENVQIVKTFTSPLDVIKHKNELQCDLFFLDVEMPDMNGFELLNFIPAKQLNIVFFTSFEKYAIEAIKNGAFDYIVKPASITDLNELFNRFKDNKIEKIKAPEIVETNNRLISINTHEKYFFINSNDVEYVEASGPYSVLYLKNNKSITASKNLKYFESILTTKNFIRVGKSLILNVLELEEIDKHDKFDKIVTKLGRSIEINKKLRNELSEKLLNY